MRDALPNRRPSVTRAVDWQGHALTVTVGFHPVTGAPSEVFADSAKGGDMAATLADASVLISIALQHGVTPAALGKSLGRVPCLRGGADLPASPVGAVVAVLLAGPEGGDGAAVPDAVAPAGGAAVGA